MTRATLAPQPTIKDVKKNPGSWTLNMKTVVISCPLCGMVAALDHAVNRDGEVSPSIICPETACSWHVFATLDGWAEGDLPSSAR